MRATKPASSSSTWEQTNRSTVQDRVRVLGVDDQLIFLDVAREVVVATPGFEWVGGATSGAEALDAVRKLTPGLVLLDVQCLEWTESRPPSGFRSAIPTQ